MNQMRRRHGRLHYLAPLIPLAIAGLSIFLINQGKEREVRIDHQRSLERVELQQAEADLEAQKKLHEAQLRAAEAEAQLKQLQTRVARAEAARSIHRPGDPAVEDIETDDIELTEAID